MSKKTIKFLLKLFVTVGFLSWIIFFIDWNEVFFYLKKIRVWHIVLYIVVLFSGFLISSYKWRILANFKGINRPFKDFFSLYYTGTFINNFMPSFLGGDAFKAYTIGEDNKKFPQATSTIIMDRITGLLGVTVVALFFSLININIVLENKILIIINSLLVASLIFDILAAKFKKVPFIKKVFKKFIPETILGFVREVYSYNNDSKVIYKSICLSILFSVVGIGILNYILFLALNIQVSFLNYLSVIFIVSIISALPISINNIGLKEWAYVTLFGIFGVSPAAVVTVAILSRFIQMIVSFFALPIYLKSRK